MTLVTWLKMAKQLNTLLCLIMLGYSFNWTFVWWRKKMKNINYWEEVVRWGNENVGFATIVLSVLTLLVSIISVIISLRTACLPYKKMLKIEVGSYIKTDGESGIHVTAINCGYMDFTINNIGFITKENKMIININSDNLYPVRLKNGDQISEYFSERDPKVQEIKSNNKIFACVKDSEGKIYKKRIKHN